jgi:hypothetical protein
MRIKEKKNGNWKRGIVSRLRLNYFYSVSWLKELCLLLKFFFRTYTKANIHKKKNQNQNF